MTQAETLESMLTIRRFEEAVVGLFVEHEFMTHFHLYIGQEGTGVPLMAALGPDDKIATHHRNHGHVLARGGDPKVALAEILGRENGFNRGAGGTMHMSDTDRGFISTSAIVGGSISLGTGAGFALKSMGGDAIAVGAVRRRRARGGRVVRVAQPRRALRAAGRLRVREQQRGRARLGRRRLPHLGVRRRRPDRHPEDVRHPGRDGRRPRRGRGGRGRRPAVEHRRARKGPFFVHAVTARFAGTQPLWPTLPTGPTDISMAWDDSSISGEHEQWYREHDPVLGYARKLLAAGEITQDELTEIDARASERIAEARQFALDSPRPTPESALDHVFA